MSGSETPRKHYTEAPIPPPAPHKPMVMTTAEHMQQQALLLRSTGLFKIKQWQIGSIEIVDAGIEKLMLEPNTYEFKVLPVNK
jgi:hypothetical protein